MVEHFMDMVAGSLRLKEPWYVESAKFDSETERVDIYIGVREDAAIPCPTCGSPTSRYGYEPQERVWRHGDCMFFPTYVHCKRQKVRCPKCGVEQISAPFERKNSRFTTYFEGVCDDAHDRHATRKGREAVALWREVDGEHPLLLGQQGG